MDRVKEFLGERLRGRAVPEDLGRLVEMQLDGELARAEILFRDVRVLGPGEVHPLEEPAGPLPGDDYAPETRANGAVHVMYGKTGTPSTVRCMAVSG